jgi:cell division protein FtsL
MAIANVTPGARRAPHEAPAPHRRGLHLVRPQPRRSRRVTNRLVFVGPVIVVATLLSVVVAQAVMTQGQVRLTGLQAQVAAAQTTRMDLELQVAQEQQPQAVIAAARRLGLAEPGQISDIPAVDPQPSQSAPRHQRTELRGRT